MSETKEPLNGWGIWREEDGTWWVQRRSDMEPEKVTRPRSEDWEQAYQQGLRTGYIRTGEAIKDFLRSRS